MTTPVRYAIYYAPPEDSPLAIFAASWLGRDAAARKVARIAPGGALSNAALERITAEPRLYGFHGTLKAPFRPGTNVSGDDLAAGVAHLAQEMPPAAAGPLTLTEIGPFLALCPTGDPSEIGVLAGRLVRDLDGLRAPLSDAERQRRRPASLSPRQRNYLERWGYPYVFGEFRFHLTLTGPLGDAERGLAREILGPLVEPFTRGPFVIADVCVFADPGDGGLFELVSRHRLSGQSSLSAPVDGT